MASGKWRVGSGEWLVGSGEWGGASGEWDKRISMGKQIISRYYGEQAWTPNYTPPTSHSPLPTYHPLKKIFRCSNINYYLALKINYMATKKWAIDPAHSEVRFKIKHLMISNVTGSLNTFEGTAETEGDDFTNAKVSFSADVNSIDTGNEQRDGHLKAGDFFETETHPKISFVSTKEEAGDDAGTFNLYGDLTIKGITKNIKLAVEAGGIVNDAYGQTKAGFTVTGKINRKDFGLTWSALTETGGVMLGDDVKIDVEVQFTEQK